MSEENAAYGTLAEKDEGKPAPVEAFPEGHFVSIDMMKGLCIIMLILTHVSTIPMDMKRKILYPFTILPALPMFMMMSVFVFALAEDRKNGTIASWFHKDVFYRRLNRFLLPYIAAVAAIVAGLFIFADMKRIAFLSVYRIFQQGGRGPGGYYILLVFQLLVVFPFFRYAFNKNPLATSVTCVTLNLLYDTAARYIWQMSDNAYDRLIVRFMGHIVLGFLLYLYVKEKRAGRISGNVIPLTAIIIGAIYSINIYYMDYAPVITYRNPVAQGLIAALFSFGVLCLVIQNESTLRKFALVLTPLRFLGKASFHILLWQMVYYYFARLQKFENTLPNLPTIILTDLACCLAGGCAFYLLDKALRGVFGGILGKKKRAV